jgi:hypothetical protein
MSTIASLLGLMDPGIKPYSEGEESVNRAALGRQRTQTGLIELEDLKRQQETNARVRQYYQQHGLGAVLGDPALLVPGGAGGMPGGGQVTQQQVVPGQPPGVPQPVPGGMDLSQFATGGAPQSTLAGLHPQANPLEVLFRTDPDAALLIQKQQQGQQDRQWKLQEQQLGMREKVAGYLTRRSQGVKNQEDLEALRQDLQQSGLAQYAARLPQFYSKEAMETLTASGQSMLENAQTQLAQATAAKNQQQAQTEEYTRTVMLPWAMQSGSTDGGGSGQPGGSAGNLGQRMNNPYNIKRGPGTEHWIDKGLAEPGEKAEDGGQFLKFKDPSYGEQAGLELLQGPGYRNLTVDAALKRWSNNGYGAEIVKDIPATTLVKDLSATQLRPLMAAMREREGWNAPRASGGTPATSGEAQRLEGTIADLTRKRNAFALTPGMNVYADNLTKQIDELTKRRDRLEEIPRAVEKQTALQPGELEKAREADRLRLEQEPATKEEVDAINRSLPPGQKIPYGMPKSEIRKRGLVGGELVPAPVLTELSNRSTVVQQLDELSTNFGALPTGPITGRLEAIKQRFGIDVTDEKVAYRQILATVLNQLLQARSGAAINEHEYQRIKGELPDPDDPQQVFKAKLATATRMAKNLYKTKAQTFRKAGYAIPDDLMEPLAAAEAPPAPKTSSNVDKFKNIKP